MPEPQHAPRKYVRLAEDLNDLLLPGQSIEWNETEINSHIPNYKDGIGTSYFDNEELDDSDPHELQTALHLYEIHIQSVDYINRTITFSK